MGFALETVLVFVLFSTFAIAIDLYAHRDSHAISLKSASLWSVFWIGVSLLFAAYLYWRQGSEAAQLFLAGYALEKVLSVDNLFVMMAIFSWFKIPEALRHRVLYWGIIGAIVFRLIFVLLGSSLLALGAYVELIFAVLIAWTAKMMLKDKDHSEEIDYAQHLAYRWVHRFFPVSPSLHGKRFFLREQGKWVATPLFLCLAVIELSDVMFAFDSVPAILAVSREPLIVYSAMMFAIFGLRTLYFVLEALQAKLVHLEKAVVVLLFFIAAKLALAATEQLFGWGFHLSAQQSLWIVLSVLAIGIIASFAFPENRK